MNFLQQLAATAIRNQVISALRANCPASLTAALEQLLGDENAINTIRDFVMGNLKNPASLTAEAFSALPYGEKTRELLSRTPALATYLAEIAHSKLPR